jgi:DNA-binding NarL/FixJ family response regulator
VHLDAAVARRLTESLGAPGPRPAEALIERERDVLKLVAQGLSNNGIAENLFVSERTARTHVSNILSKLGFVSRTQAALWAIREGLVPAPSRSRHTGRIQ